MLDEARREFLLAKRADGEEEIQVSAEVYTRGVSELGGDSGEWVETEEVLRHDLEHRDDIEDDLEEGATRAIECLEDERCLDEELRAEPLPFRLDLRVLREQRDLL